MPLVVHLTSRVDFLEEVKAKKHIHVFSRAKTFVKAETNTPFWCIFFFQGFRAVWRDQREIRGEGRRQTDRDRIRDRETDRRLTERQK